MSIDDAFYANLTDDSVGLNFNGYQPTTTNPGVPLFLVTLLIIILLMAILMPCMVISRKRARRKMRECKAVNTLWTHQSTNPYVTKDETVKPTSSEPEKGIDLDYVKLEEQAAPITVTPIQSMPVQPKYQSEKSRASIKSIFRMDKESRRILRHAAPLTFYNVATSVLSNVCLALISWYVGTKQVAAYAVVGILVSLSEEFLKGPIYANTTMIAQAIGANNNVLAGQYVQLSLSLYLIMGTPFLVFWYFFTYEIILYLAWGDESVAGHGQAFVDIYIWSYVSESIHQAIGQLLDVTGHEMFTTTMELLKSATNVITLVYWIESGTKFTLNSVAWMYLSTSLAYLFLSTVIAVSKGWLKPFMKGMIRSPAIINSRAVAAMLKVAIPLAFWSVLSNAEWAVLTFMAASLGPAEVAAWAILASIWSFFSSLTKGIGDAAEIRVAYHLGNKHPSLAKLSAYKSLFLGMIGSGIVSIVFLSFMIQIPSWFTPDKTLQEMIGATLPYIGMGNIALTFGYLCWYMICAQGRYKLGTWINFVANWGVTIPLAAAFTFYFHFDLQGLTAAVVLGYVGVGAALSYVLLTSDWDARAAKIQSRNDGVAAGETKKIPNNQEDAEEAVEEIYSALVGRRSRASRAAGKRNITVFTAPPGKLGIQIGTLPHRTGVMVTCVMPSSPFFGRIWMGDIILSVDGYDATKNSPASTIYDIMTLHQDNDRELTVLTTPGRCRDEYSNEVLMTGNFPDIDDFESFDLEGLLS